MADHRTPPRSAAAASIRERLLVAATEIASASGREAVTLERLADRAGMSPGDVVTIFPDTQACLLAAYDEWVERGLRAIEAPLAAGGGDAPALGELRGEPDREPGAHREPGAEPGGSSIESLLIERLGTLFGCLAERPEVARLCLVEIPSAGVDGQAARDDALGRYRTSLERQLVPFGAGPRTERVGEMAAGAIYDVVQRAAHDDALEQLPELVLPLVRTWAPAFGEQF